MHYDEASVLTEYVWSQFEQEGQLVGFLAIQGSYVDRLYVRRILRELGLVRH